MELEIALAIPAPKDEKYNWNNSAGHGTWVEQYFLLCKYPHYQKCIRKNILYYAFWYGTVSISLFYGCKRFK